MFIASSSCDILSIIYLVDPLFGILIYQFNLHKLLADVYFILCPCAGALSPFLLLEIFTSECISTFFEHLAGCDINVYSTNHV